MPFTEKEAKAEVGKHVSVRSNEFLSEGVPIGTHGEVVGYQCKDGVWTVSVQFYPPNKPGGILIWNIGKEQYDNSLKEDADFIYKNSLDEDADFIRKG